MRSKWMRSRNTVFSSSFKQKIVMWRSGQDKYNYTYLDVHVNNTKNTKKVKLFSVDAYEAAWAYYSWSINSGINTVLIIFAANVWEQTSTFTMVTMATGAASAGLSRCFNGARWWMTPLLYHSMLCHLQLNTTPAHSPPHLRMLFAL